MGTEKVAQAQLDEYVLGTLPKEAARAMEARIATDPELKARVYAISAAFEARALSNAVSPSIDLRRQVLSALDNAVNEKLRSGTIPDLHSASTVKELAAHLDHPDVFLPAGTRDFHQVVLEASPERCTVVVWLKDGFPEETHATVVERILILEGSCDVLLGNVHHQLQTGDVITIPMHVRHSVKVTSDGWCKAIVQRVAA